MGYTAALVIPTNPADLLGVVQLQLNGLRIFLF